jgi:hypothetical protein
VSFEAHSIVEAVQTLTHSRVPNSAPQAAAAAEPLDAQRATEILRDWRDALPSPDSEPAVTVIKC